MPLMPDLNVNFNPDEEEEEDAAEEKNLMTILLKLKTAKSSLEASRKRYILLFEVMIQKYYSWIVTNIYRKHYQQNIDDTYAVVCKDNKDQVNKHKKRWSAKISQVRNICAVMIRICCSRI